VVAQVLIEALRGGAGKGRLSTLEACALLLAQLAQPPPPPPPPPAAPAVAGPSGGGMGAVRPPSGRSLECERVLEGLQPLARWLQAQSEGLREQATPPLTPADYRSLGCDDACMQRSTSTSPSSSPLPYTCPARCRCMDEPCLPTIQDSGSSD
jgi:hypothetical protein